MNEEQKRDEEKIPVAVEPKRNWSTVSRSAGRTTHVASPAADRMTLWHLRQFVQAADEAGVPDEVRVTGHSQPERGLHGVSVRFEEKINGWPTDATQPEGTPNA